MPLVWRSIGIRMLLIGAVEDEPQMGGEIPLEVGCKHGFIERSRYSSGL